MENQFELLLDVTKVKMFRQSIINYNRILLSIEKPIKILKVSQSYIHIPGYKTFTIEYNLLTDLFYLGREMGELIKAQEKIDIFIIRNIQ